MRKSQMYPNAYQKNPSNASLYFTGLTTPHAITNRGTYTVPPGRIAQIMGALVSVHIQTVASTTGIKYSIITIDTRPLILTYLNQNSNTIGEIKTMNIGISAVLFEGQTIDFLTRDSSIDGTVTYKLSAFILEYDA